MYSPDVLIDKVHVQWHIPSVAQVVFSTLCSHYIGPHENISHAQFIELLAKSGGSKGHAKLYMLPYNQLKQAQIVPDTTCFTPLSELGCYFGLVRFYYLISFLQSTQWMTQSPLLI